MPVHHFINTGHMCTDQACRKDSAKAGNMFNGNCFYDQRQYNNPSALHKSQMPHTHPAVLLSPLLHKGHSSTDVHNPQSMNSTDFDDPVPPAG